MKLAISLLTCDKPELVEQSIKPLLAGALDHKFHLFVVDGSTTEANQQSLFDLAYPTATIMSNVRGGAGAAIVYALTHMLKHKENYTHVGLVESDVLLLSGWLDCLDLFSKGAGENLDVGCVSARAYEDRVLFQRDGYAAMHNVGAGMSLFTRQAAQLILDSFRTPWTSDNRRIFAQLCAPDIGSYWAFRHNEHYLTADWHWDAVLAANGLASLALTPSPVEMIGQNPPLAEQGLTIVKEPVEARRDDVAFDKYVWYLKWAREQDRTLGVDTKFHYDVANATWTYFPHQIHMLGGEYVGDWRFEECRGFGTFKWVAGETTGQVYIGPIPPGVVPTSVLIPVFGSCSILVSGGKTGGKVDVVDEQSGFKASPDLPPEGEQGQVLQMMIPGGLVYRNIGITALTPGIVFYGIQSREKQPFLPNVTFDHSVLPAP